MTSMYTTANNGTAFAEFALVARLVDTNDGVAGHTGPPAREHVLDRTELADLVAEAIAESQRVHGAHGHTLWGDAAEAASLILRHVAAICGVDPETTTPPTDRSTSAVIEHDEGVDLTWRTQPRC